MSHVPQRWTSVQKTNKHTEPQSNESNVITGLYWKEMPFTRKCLTFLIFYQPWLQKQVQCPAWSHRWFIVLPELIGHRAAQQILSNCPDHILGFSSCPPSPLPLSPNNQPTHLSFIAIGLSWLILQPCLVISALVTPRNQHPFTSFWHSSPNGSSKHSSFCI